MALEKEKSFKDK